MLNMDAMKYEIDDSEHIISINDFQITTSISSDDIETTAAPSFPQNIYTSTVY